MQWLFFYALRRECGGEGGTLTQPHACMVCSHAEVRSIEQTFDWDAVMAAYVSSTKSLAQIAAQFGIKERTIQKRSSEDGWVAARAEFRAKATAKALETAVDVEADRLGKIISAANSMAVVIEDIFTDGKQFHRHLVTDTEIDEDGAKSIYTVEREFDKVDTRAIKDLTGALKDMTLVLRNLNNLPTQAEAEAQRIAAERLEMDKRKMDAETNVDKEIKVVFAGDMERFAK